MVPRRFASVEDGSNKFWEIEATGSTLVTRWGRAGTAGQSKTKVLGSAEEAEREAEKLIAAKRSKGYEEVPAGALAREGAGPLERAIERARAFTHEHPDELLIVENLPPGKKGEERLAELGVTPGYHRPNLGRWHRPKGASDLATASIPLPAPYVRFLADYGTFTWIARDAKVAEGRWIGGESRNGYVAVEEDEGDLVTQLVALGANVNALSRNGKTALDVATSKKRKEIVKILREAGAKTSAALGRVGRGE